MMISAAVVAGGFLTLTTLLYRGDRGPAYARISTGSQIAPSRCGPIEYAVKGEGPPVLVVHGAGGGFDQGLEVADSIALAGFRVIAMSRFGYLRTPLPADASAPAQADAHACLLDSLNIKKAAIAGVSAGGPSALQFALRFPDRTAALVLLVPAAYAPRPNHEPPRRMSRATMFLFNAALRSDFLFWAGGKIAHDTFISATLGTPSDVVASASAEEQSRLETLFDYIQPISLRRAGLLNDAAVTSSLPRYELEKIAAPTLAISAADDLYGTFDGARYTAEHVPHARFIGYPRGGHMLVGRNAEATSEITAFLKGSAKY
jgi:pimeloyl-ACP methyl ester carboxylesterase